MRLDPRCRAAFYGIASVLFGTGAADLAVDRWQDPLAPGAWREAGVYLIMAHGGAAMLFLLILGSLAALHIPTAWRSGGNRTTGVAVLASNAVLIVTALGLYYIGSETLRPWVSDLHLAVGLGFPALLAAHVALGRRRLRCAEARRADAAPCQATPRSSLESLPPRPSDGASRGIIFAPVTRDSRCGGVRD